jgi:uncharacterized lipoprotein
MAGSLPGCFSSKNPDEHCNDVSEYQGSRSVPGIVVPEGLAEPSRSTAFVVPPAAGDAAELAETGAACLSRPPDFFRRDPPPEAR